MPFVFILYPFVLLGTALLRGLVLFFPVMILLGMVHGFLPWVPALGWVETFQAVALLGILLPGGAVGANSITTTRNTVSKR